MSLIKDSKGSLLLEALLSVVILSVSLTLIIQSMTSSLRASVYGGDYTLAVVLLENKMFELLTEGLPQSHQTETLELPFSANVYHFSAETRLMAGQDQESKIKEADVDLAWNSGQRKNKVSLITYFLEHTDEE